MYGLDRYIYVNETSLSEDLCEEIMYKHSIEPGKSPGSTFGGVMTDVKDTVDYCIMDDPNWSRIRETLISELLNNIHIYVSKLDTVMYHSQPSSINNIKGNIKNNNFKELNVNSLFFETLMVQKYQCKKGRYVYHQDGHCESNKRNRILTYIWYLNDVEEGGETQFWDNYKIKPQKGKLVLFPAAWMYPHTGLMPISNDKYIITGWVYQNELNNSY